MLVICVHVALLVIALALSDAHGLRIQSSSFLAVKLFVHVSKTRELGGFLKTHNGKKLK